jgi:hypothetical protein
MLTVVAQTLQALCAVTQSLPVGTNLALLHFMWMLVTGMLLPYRGALFPALQAIGLSAAGVRRAWAAFRYGAWDIATLLSDWERYVAEQGQWQPNRYEGYVPKAVDLTAFWRPRLQGCQTKHFYPPAERALPAIVLGVVARVGRVLGYRFAVLTDLVLAESSDSREADLQTRLVRRVAAQLTDDEMPVFDAGFHIRELQAAQLPRYVVRLADNFTARRNVLLAYSGHGRRPSYGQRVRPLARTRKGKTLPATPSDRQETWTEAGLTFRAEFWDEMVLPDVKVQPKNLTFTVAAIHDPRYQKPWLLACPVRLGGAAFRGLYRDRWPVEQIPLAAKQMLGAQRQFVFAPDSQQRLPMLALLAGTILTYLAATLPVLPSGFWDRRPRPTSGRLRRVLARTPFPETCPLPGRFREKDSVTAHLPKGILGHRRQKSSQRS